MVGVMLGATVIGMEVTIVEPCASVVVTFANEAVEGALLVLATSGCLKRCLSGTEPWRARGWRDPVRLTG